MSLSKNTLTTLLLVSVALNLLIAGALGGAALAGLRHGPPAGPGPAPIHKNVNFRFSPQRFIHALPGKERRKAIRTMRQAAAAHKKLFRNITRTRIELARLLAAGTWDEDAIQKAFARLRALDSEQQQLAQGMMLDILRNLDPQTRRQVIRVASHPRLREPRQRRPPPQ